MSLYLLQLILKEEVKQLLFPLSALLVQREGVQEVLLYEDVSNNIFKTRSPITTTKILQDRIVIQQSTEKQNTALTRI